MNQRVVDGPCTKGVARQDDLRVYAPVADRHDLLVELFDPTVLGIDKVSPVNSRPGMYRPFSGGCATSFRPICTTRCPGIIWRTPHPVKTSFFLLSLVFFQIFLVGKHLLFQPAP